MTAEKNIGSKNETFIDQESISEIKKRVRNVPVSIVIPPSPFLTDERVFPALGPIKVATELQENGNPISVLDLSGVKNHEEILLKYSKDTRSQYYGISATTPQMPMATEIARVIKDVNPDAVVVLGGAHATLVHAAAKKDSELQQIRRGIKAFLNLKEDFDRIVTGDGELAIFPAIDNRNTNFVVDASSRKSQLFLQKGTLGRFRPPNRNLIDLEDYYYYIEDENKTYRATSVIANLGCPFECGFCGGRDTDSFRITRTRDVVDVIGEIETAVEDSENWEEPLRGIMFYDDELNINPRTLGNLSESLINMQKRLGIDMRFRGFVKAELFTREQAQLMYDTGFRVLLTGVESGSSKILDTMHKHTTPEVNSKFIQTAHAAGMRVKALMSIGHPGETEGTISESIDWVTKNLIPGWDDVDWTVITQYPGSPYFDQSVFIESEGAWLYTEPKTKRRLWSLEMDYRKDTGAYKGIPGQYTAFFWTNTLSLQDLVRQRDYAEALTRGHLLLPKIKAIPPRQFDHSMGQGFSPKILRTANLIEK